jgi:small-conductance mechanosensitive channel
MMDFFKELSRQEYIQFFSWLAAIWILKYILQFFAARRQWAQPEAKEGMLSVLNWAAFYASLILFLNFFATQDWLNYTLYQAGDVKVSLRLIFTAFLIVSLANKFVRVLTLQILSSVYEHYHVDRGMRYTFNRFIYYAVMIAAVAVSLTTVGLDLTAAGAALGVLGIGIGFGMRNIAGNFISGIIILFERPVEVGELIEINNKIGTIESIRLRSTIVRTAKEGTLIVPNQHFIEQIIKNRTGSEMLASVELSVEFGEDTGRIESLLKEAVLQEADRFSAYLKVDLAEIRLVDFRYNTMLFLIEVPVRNFDTKQKYESRLRHAIAGIFYEHNIRLASFPALKGEAGM